MGRRFNPPPGWPDPGPGWTPPPGWLPNPAWPPAPPGWDYWSYSDPTPIRQVKRVVLGPVRTHPARKLARSGGFGFLAFLFVLAAVTPASPPRDDGTATAASVPSSARPSPSPTLPAGVPAQAQRVVVDEVVDGQTVRLHALDDRRGGFRKGTKTTVALLGLASPRGKQCHSGESKTALEARLSETTPVYAAAAKGGVLLWANRGESINLRLVQDGDARAVKSADAGMKQAEVTAKAMQSGVWSSVCVKPKPTPSPTPTAPPTSDTPTEAPPDTPTDEPSEPGDGGGDHAPSGATALCRDGTYSFSAHRRGTCSHHGGVAQWL
ncbi:DUF3761 domain-containing protein [Actinomadura rupiterrae]|uniref:DUF3761 domain-containing protein n=1 Tax=Actinomadura rupiterrae TaxID=559627 RepID=UPI0020A4E5E7|nr:DUF3761 domain-containing protein [Actinomadura rupiterrae]MCP2336054.1 endonuclease YncB(thermonuclease family) [Actinomadura rupiterrae]